MTMVFHNGLPKPYPFSALIGQAPLQQALLLAAIDPGIGGVLVSGPRGTAKSTAARALAELLPTGRFVTLPLGASEERLIGSLDLDEVLRGGAVRFSPGLLAQAHEGVLYVDEINLLPDALVDVLLDAAASGVNIVERDGLSHSHEARFVLIGTMNPEEGELRPQLLDRFGLMVELENCFDVSERQRIVKARLAFDADPDAFRAACAPQQQALVTRIGEARERLVGLAFDDAVHAAVGVRCIEAGVDGLRADLVMLRAARALAAFEGVVSITIGHVERVAPAVLLHRRRACVPAQQTAGDGVSGRAEGQVDEAQGTVPTHGQAQQEASGRGGSRADDGCRSDDADWGYLPAEPAGMVRAKGVITLAAKKR